MLNNQNNANLSSEPEAVYPYCDAVGQVLYEVVRLPGKQFRVRRPKGNGTYEWNLDGIERLPYRLNEVLVAEEVFIVEGEKDVETLRGLEIIASTNPGGAGGWREEFTQYFRGKRVIVLPDQDAPGHKWADRVLLDLHGTATQVKRIDLPGLEFGSGADVSDWINSGHHKAELRELVEAAPLWEPVGARGNALIPEVERFIARFLILPESSSFPLAIWVIATSIFQSFAAFPYVCILSPTKQCGKTRLTEVRCLLAANAYRTVGISEAALFRLIEQSAPTLILDEAEALTGKSDRAEAIRALLNAGNRRNITVPRCQGNAHDLKLFSIYCPKVIVAIGNCPETIRDRSIVVLMQRRKMGEQVERFLARRVEPEALALKAGLEAFTRYHKDEIERDYERLDLQFLQDRDAEAWEPLFAVLKVADPSRWAELQGCALTLTGEKTATDIDDSLSLKLLADIDAVWPEAQATVFTSELITSLRAIEESPWQDDLELTPRKLARLLRPFVIQPRQVRLGDRTAKGYNFEELEAAFARYLGGKGKHAKRPS